jgi:hypothetical protein
MVWVLLLLIRRSDKKLYVHNQFKPYSIRITKCPDQTILPTDFSTITPFCIEKFFDSGK